MSSTNVAIPFAREQPCARNHRLDRQLARFAWRHRAAVSALAARHSRLADLAFSFPALLFALAVPRRNFDPAWTIARVIAGAPLAELAAAARIPLWTRKLGAEAFQRPIPALPDNPEFCRQIANHWPASAQTASLWLEMVAATAFWGHDAFAIWIARGIARGGARLIERHWRLLALWAWHTTKAAPEFPAVSWKPEMSAVQALAAAGDWNSSVIVKLTLDRAAMAGVEPAVVDGLSFEPVLTAADLIAEARTLSNCAREHSHAMASGHVQIWVAKRDGKTVAMLRVGVYPVPTLNEILGPANRTVAPDLAVTAHRWLRDNSKIELMPLPRRMNVDHQRWRGAWRAYWLEKQAIPAWLPMAAPRRLYRWLEPGRVRRR